jgi:hypothetical protein
MGKKSQQWHGHQRFGVWILISHFLWLIMTRSLLVPVFGDELIYQSG